MARPKSTRAANPGDRALLLARGWTLVERFDPPRWSHPHLCLLGPRRESIAGSGEGG